MKNTSDGKFDIKAFAVLVLVVFIWGFDFIGTEYLARYMSMSLMTCIRLGISAVIMTGFTLIKYRGIHIEKRDLPKMILVGVFGMGIYFILEAQGIAKVSSPMASLIMTLIPIFGLFADRIFYKSKITGVKIIGILGSIAGVALLVLTTGEKLTGNIIGVLILLAGTVIWTLYIVFSKPIYSKYNLPTAMSVMLISGAVVTFPLIFITDSPVYFHPAPSVYPVLLGMTVLSILMCDTMYAYAISRLSVTLVSLSENIIPLVTVFFAWIFLGSTLSPLQLIGGLVIILSVTVITLKE